MPMRVPLWPDALIDRPVNMALWSLRLWRPERAAGPPSLPCRNAPMPGSAGGSAASRTFCCGLYCDELVSLPKNVLTHFVGMLSVDKLRALDKALTIALQIQMD
jgi:hypothetical protein